ncbi:Mth938-like domain-containing protein [Sphingomonas profundi]|uniref:Mth938-like domain-containing protein n=1 Tax=Alterirhizorhabdus profundi TaxID=2681549 RepID=UPI0012E9772C|nr:Mth938-like domain-containing protein [Sphingomonas profundi]
MPALEREPPAGGPIVRGFAGRGFRLGDDAIYPDGLLMTWERATAWTAPPLDALTEADVAALLVPPPEFLLLGTGPSLRRPPAAFTAALEARDVGVEVMDSRAAARLWGVLRGEGRQIVAALLPL